MLVVARDAAVLPDVAVDVAAVVVDAPYVAVV